MILYNETPFVWGTWISPPASIEPMTLTLGGLTARLYEQLSYFKISLLDVVARPDARPSGMRPVADSILTSGTYSWKENGHEKISTTIISLPLIQERAVVSYWQKNVH